MTTPIATKIAAAAVHRAFNRAPADAGGAGARRVRPDPWSRNTHHAANAAGWSRRTGLASAPRAAERPKSAPFLKPGFSRKRTLRHSVNVARNVRNVSIW